MEPESAVGRSLWKESKIWRQLRRKGKNLPATPIQLVSKTCPIPGVQDEEPGTHNSLGAPERDDDFIGFRTFQDESLDAHFPNEILQVTSQDNNSNRLSKMKSVTFADRSTKLCSHGITKSTEAGFAPEDVTPDLSWKDAVAFVDGFRPALAVKGSSAPATHHQTGPNAGSACPSPADGPQDRFPTGALPLSEDAPPPPSARVPALAVVPPAQRPGLGLAASSPPRGAAAEGAGGNKGAAAGAPLGSPVRGGPRELLRRRKSQGLSQHLGSDIQPNTPLDESYSSGELISSFRPSTAPELWPGSNDWGAERPSPKTAGPARGAPPPPPRRAASLPAPAAAAAAARRSGLGPGNGGGGGEDEDEEGEEEEGGGVGGGGGGGPLWGGRGRWELEEDLEEALAADRRRNELDGVRCFAALGETTGTALDLTRRRLLPLGPADPAAARSPRGPGRRRRRRGRGPLALALAVEEVAHPTVTLDGAGRAVAGVAVQLALQEVATDASLRPLRLPGLLPSALRPGALRMPMLRLANLARDAWEEPVRSREKDWRLESQRAALGGDSMARPPPDPSKMKFGKYTKYQLESRQLVWSPQDQTTISRERLLCQGLLISSTFALVTVWGFGTAGSVFADVMTRPRRLTVEAYDARTCRTAALDVDVEDFRTIFARRPALLAPGAKAGFAPALLRMLYFKYYRVEEDNFCEKERHYLGTEITQKDLDDIQAMNEKGSELYERRKNNTEQEQYTMNAWLDLELCLDTSRDRSAFEALRARVLARRRAEQEELNRLRALWLNTPKFKRGVVAAAARKLNGHLVVLLLYEFPDRPNAAVLKGYHPWTGAKFGQALGNRMVSRALGIKSMMRHETKPDYRKEQYQAILDGSDLGLTQHYDDPDHTVLRWGRFYGTPGETCLELKRQRFWHNPCQNKFRHDRRHIFDDKQPQMLPSALHPEFSRRRRPAHGPWGRPARLVGRGRPVAAGAARVGAARLLYTLRLECEPRPARRDPDGLGLDGEEDGGEDGFAPPPGGQEGEEGGGAPPPPPPPLEEEVEEEGEEGSGAGPGAALALTLDAYLPFGHRHPELGRCDPGAVLSLRLWADDLGRLAREDGRPEAWLAATKFDGRRFLEMIEEEVAAAEAAWEYLAQLLIQKLHWSSVLERAYEAPEGEIASVRKPVLASEVAPVSRGSSTLCLELDCVIYRRLRHINYSNVDRPARLVWVVVAQAGRALRFLACAPGEAAYREALQDPATGQALILSLRSLNLMERQIQIEEIIKDLFYNVDETDQRESLVFIENTQVKLEQKIDHDDYAAQVEKMTAATLEKTKNRTHIKGGKKVKARNPLKGKKKRR